MRWINARLAPPLPLPPPLVPRSLWVSSRPAPRCLTRQMEAIVNEGKLLPDSMILRVIRERFVKEHADSKTIFLLDGFPRTAPQAEALEQIANVQLALDMELREEVRAQHHGCRGRRAKGAATREKERKVLLGVGVCMRAFASGAAWAAGTGWQWISHRSKRG